MVLSASPAAPPSALDAPEYDSSSILVRFQPGAAAHRAEAGTELGREFQSIPGLRSVHLRAGVSVNAALQAYRSNPNVLYAEPNFVQHVALTTPNDTSFSSLYGLHNTGQLGGTVDADIDAPEAWDITKGNPNIVVGVIDTGVNYNHPDLAANMWKNMWEFNGVAGNDDDGNGFVDDVYGYDFIGAGDSNPADDHFHGSHVSGTIGAVGNNNVGVVGVNWNVKIMALKFLNSAGSGTTEDAVQAVNYATMMRNLYNSTSGAKGANIVLTSNSWGGGGFSQALQDAIAASRAANMLFVAAAGNDGVNTDGGGFYPATYPLDNIISVAATDRNDNRAYFSNWGRNTVDLAAPGVDVLSTSLGNGYTTVSGTSMATPHVAGVAALAWGLAGDASYQQIRDAIFDSVDPNTAFRTDGPTPVATGGRLNAFKTLQAVGMSVGGSTPAAGSIISTQPTDFVVNFSHPYDTTTVQPGDLKVNNIAASSRDFTDSDTVTFHFGTSPVSGQGEQTMHMAAGAVAAAGTTLPDPLLHAWTATFHYDTLRMEVVSASPPGPKAGAPLTTYVVNLNEAVNPLTVSASDLTLSLGTVTGYSLENSNTTIRFALGGITEAYVGWSLGASIAEGAFSDGNGNPNLAFNRTYELVLGMGVGSSSPARDEIVPTAPTQFVIAFNFAVDPSTLDASDLEVYSDGLPAQKANSVSLAPDGVTATFTFASTPVSEQGLQTMHMPAGAVKALPASGLPDLASAEWTAPFRYDVTPMEIVSTNPAGPLAGVPLKTFDLNLNEVVDPESVSTGDLYLYHDWWGDWYVDSVEVLPGDSPGTSKIRFHVPEIWDLGNLYAYVAPGAFTDEFDNPSQPFERWYQLVTGMGVAGSTPAAGDVVGTQPADFFINFTLPYNTDPLLGEVVDPADLTVNGKSANSFELIDGDTVKFHFNAQPAPPDIQGEWTMHMEAGAVDVDPSIGLSDPGNTEWTGTFRYDALPMAVVDTDPDANVGTLVTLPLTTLVVHLNEEVDPASLQTFDLNLSQGSVYSVSVDPLDPSNKTLVYELRNITAEGTLFASIAPGALTDEFGNPNLAFSGSYQLDIGTVPYPTPLAPVTPLGSLIYNSTASGIIGTAGDPDKFTINVDGNQTITVLVTPSGTLRPTVDIGGPPVTAASAGKKALLQTLAAGGVHTITVSGADGTTGSYTVQVFLNAALETESNDGAPNNSPGPDPGGAQDLNASFTNLLKGATRGAVLGRTDGNPTETLLNADFETTTGHNLWTKNTVANNLWHQSIGHRNESGHSATHSMYFGAGEKYVVKGRNPETFTKGTYEVLKKVGKGAAQPQIVSGTITSPNIVLKPGGQVTVDFNYLLVTESNPGLDVAALQIKPLGSSTWTTLETYNDDFESSSWIAASTVDLSSYAGQTVQLQFSFNSVTKDNNRFEGWYVDDVVVNQTMPRDNYSVSVGAGQYLTVALQSAGDVNVLLQNQAGTSTLASGLPGAINVSKMIYNYGPLAAGTYNLAITGQANTPYTMVVLRDAVFDREGNDTSATAQPFGATHVALGSLSNGESLTLNAYDSGWWNSWGNHDDWNDNYIAGRCCEGAGDDYRDFFVFDLSGVAQQISAAELRIENPYGGYFSPDSSETYTLFDISTPLADLQASGSGQTAIFNDLGTGSSHGSQVVSYADDGQVVSVNLNSAGVAALNASLGGQTALGGAVTTLSGFDDQHIFGYSYEVYSRQLVLTLADPADWYYFSAAAGETIVLDTATPGAGAGEPGNTLDPHIELFNTLGAKVEDTRTVLDDQGNEKITYKVPVGAGGIHRVKVTAESGSGDYVLDPISIAPSPPPALSLLASAKSNRGVATAKNALVNSARGPATSSKLNPSGVDQVVGTNARGSQPEWLKLASKADLDPSLLDLLAGTTARGRKGGLK